MNNPYLSSKPRYEILDGLRGVAALMVLLFHCLETYSWKWGVQIIDHGYLAVDFFFLLSGFVVGYAYDDRWNRMSLSTFFKRRLVRLHPMVVMGTLIGVCFFFFRQSALFPVVDGNDGWVFLIAFLMCLVMIPCKPSVGTEQLHTWDEFNPFNGPNWSLTYEYVANIIYALVLRHLPNMAIAILCVLSAFLTIDLTLGLDVFGFFPDGAQYTVIGGWSLTSQSLYIGFTRLAYPFLCGYLVSRLVAERATDKNPSGSPLHIKGGFWWCALTLMVVFSIPQISNGQRGIADGLYQALSILIVFPIVILIGAGSNIKGKRSISICKWLGDISFPLYITHYPLMYCQMAWATTHPNAPAWMHIVMNIGVIALSIAIGWACLKLYDEPVRKWLTDHWLKHKH